MAQTSREFFLIIGQGFKELCCKIMMLVMKLGFEIGTPFGTWDMLVLYCIAFEDQIEVKVIVGWCMCAYVCTKVGQEGADFIV